MGAEELLVERAVARESSLAGEKPSLPAVLHVDPRRPPEAREHAYSRPRLGSSSAPSAGPGAWWRASRSSASPWTSTDRTSTRPCATRSGSTASGSSSGESPAARDELDRLLEVGRTIVEELDDAGHDGGAPAKPGVALMPPPGPYTRHAFLALRVDAFTVDVCFALPPQAKVDVDNLRARLGDGELTAELMGALAALPEQFAIGVAPEDRVAASSATPEAIRGMIERAAAGQVPLWIGWSVGRETAAAHADILDEQLEDAIVALAPIYRLIAWSRENDRIALDRRMESVVEERARVHAAAEARTERWRVEQAEARQKAAEQARPRAPVHGGEPRRSGARPSLDALFSGLPPRSPRPPKAEAPAPKPAPAARPPGEPQAEAGVREAPAAGSAGFQPAPGGRPEAGAPAVVEKGGKVCVLSGPFAGKVGVIGELDGRGGARVLLGLLSTRLDLGALEPVAEGRDRPAIQSSHRKLPSPSGAARERAVARPHPAAPAPRKAR